MSFAILQACMKSSLMICAKMQGDERVNRVQIYRCRVDFSGYFVAALRE